MPINLNPFLTWQAEKPHIRMVSISIESRIMDDEQVVSIWCWDSKLQAGQYVQDVSEINLEQVKEEKERNEYERLREKYGSNGGNRNNGSDNTDPEAA
jgi:hypothetical protein